MWKCSYFFVVIVLLTGCAGQRTVGLQYEAGLFRLAERVPKKTFDIEVIDNRASDHLGELLSNRGWKLGGLRASDFVNETYRSAIVADLKRAGFRIEKGCKQKVIIGIDELESTFVYDTFRPTSKAQAVLSVSLLYEGSLLYSKKYEGLSNDIYYITGKKVAAKNAMNSINAALRSAFTDPEFLQTIVE